MHQVLVHLLVRERQARAAQAKGGVDFGAHLASMEQRAEQRLILLRQFVAHGCARRHARLPVWHERLVGRSMRPVRREALARRDITVGEALHLQVDIRGGTIRHDLRTERDAVEAQEEVLLWVDRLDLNAEPRVVPLANAVGLSSSSSCGVVEDLAIVDVQGGGDVFAVPDLLAVDARLLGATLEAAAVGWIRRVDLILIVRFQMAPASDCP
eukprot:7231717-Prymnesium_polylepis.2